MAETNEIKVTFVGGEQQPAGGSGNTGSPAGSSQDRGPASRSTEDQRPNFDLDELFGVTSTAPTPTRHTAAPSLESQRKRQQEEDERNAAIQEESDRRQRVQRGLENQRAQEDAERKREEEKTRKEDERAKAKEERELNAELRRQYRQQQLQAKEEKKAENELNADLKRQYKQQQAAEREKANAEKKAEKDAKDAVQDQRMRSLQLGQGAQQLAGAKSASGVIGGLSQVAGSGALGEGAAALAGGPVGAAVAAGAALYDTAKGLIQQQYAGYREMIQGAGNAASNVFGNNYNQVRQDVTEGAAKGLEKLGLAGVIAAEELRTVSAAVDTFNQVIDAAVKRGKELEGYSATIAGANAAADVRRMNRDIAEAQRNENSFARITDAQSRMEDTTRAIFDPIKDALLEALADVVEPIADIAQDLRPLFKWGAGNVAMFARIGSILLTLPLSQTAAVLDWVIDTFIPNWRKEDDLPNALQELDKAVENIRNGTAARQPPDKDTSKVNRTKMPAFFGG